MFATPCDGNDKQIRCYRTAHEFHARGERLKTRRKRVHRVASERTIKRTDRHRTLDRDRSAISFLAFPCLYLAFTFVRCSLSFLSDSSWCVGGSTVIQRKAEACSVPANGERVRQSSQTKVRETFVIHQHSRISLLIRAVLRLIVDYQWVEGRKTNIVEVEEVRLRCSSGGVPTVRIRKNGAIQSDAG